MSFVFYDTETTGTDRIFNQILQFAAIRTDENLDEIERFDTRCRLLPHVVPSPGAMRVTGISVAQLTSAEFPTHYVMVRAIRHKLLAWSPGLFIGYNSMGFDEHLLRQALYQTLHPPYLTNTNGNCRADVLRMVRAAALLTPNAITIPVDENGKPSFKLDKLAPANGFDHLDAHDALGDVRATIHICKLLSERAPELWSRFLRFTQKAAVVDYITSEPVFSLTEGFYGELYSSLATLIGPSPSRRSDILVLDLAFDPGQLRSLSDEDLVTRLAVAPRPVRAVRCNACPIIMPAEEAPDIATAKALGMAELRRRAHLLQGDAQSRERLIVAYERTQEAWPLSPHVEAQIYDAFISNDDEQRLEIFHETPWEERLAFLDQIVDLRLRQLGRRLIFFERPELLPEEVRKRMTRAVAKRLTAGDGAGTWLCLAEAIQEADDLLASASTEEMQLLQEHRHYLATRLKELSAYTA